ncbi:MAG: hypothetical protein R3B09_30935 [Nannocystaceae bacterium]
MPDVDPAALARFRDCPIEQELQGILLDDPHKLEAIDNGVSTIRLFEADPLVGARAALRAAPAAVDDPEPRPDLLGLADPAARAELAGDPVGFRARLQAAIARSIAYLRPDYGTIAGASTRFAHNAIVGGRIKRLMDEAVAAADALYAGAPAAHDAASYAIHTAIFDLYSRDVRFDDFEITGYGSYGHDAGFLHAWELRLAELGGVDPALQSDDERAADERARQQLQAELDAVLRRKYVYNNDALFEVNAEVSIGLCLIDGRSRRRVSEVAETRSTLVPAFEVITLGEGEAARGVYYDAFEDKHYFDGSDEVVAGERLPELRRRRLSADEAQALTFRRPRSGEHLRKNLRFDWDGDGYVHKARIEWASWAGHCNDKANLESHGVVIPPGDEGVWEYESAAGTTARYTRDLLNEMLMSLSELGTRMIEPRSGRRSDLSKDEFAGARDDDRPDRLVLGPRLTVPYRDRPGELEIQSITLEGRTYEGDAIFRPHLVAEDGRSAEPNPLYVDTTEGDRVSLRLAGAIVHLRLRLQVFDESGYPALVQREVTLDFKDPPEAPILVDTIMKDAAARELYEVSLDLRARAWLAQLVRMEARPDGEGYDPVAVDAPIRKDFDPAALTGQRETSLDDPALYVPFLKEALQTGRNFTSETADGAGVWNGRTRRLSQKTEWRDDATRWAKVRVDVDARYGGNNGAFLVKHGVDGKPERFVPLALPFDFAWRSDVACVPVDGERVNEVAHERGVITAEGGRYRAEALTDLCELLHCAFSGRSHLIRHRGRRYFFRSRGAWEAARDRLEALRLAVRGGGVTEPVEPVPGDLSEGEGPQAPAEATLLEVAAGRVDRKAFVAHEVVAEADGDLRFTLDTRSGDADLYLRLGGPATPEDGGHTHASTQFGLRREALTLPGVARGTTVGVAVFGYKASDYALVVRGPRPGAIPEPPTAIHETLSGVIAAGEEHHLPQPIVLPRGGELDLQLSGSGDADVYVEFGRPATWQSASFRLDGPTSNERGRVLVRAGDPIHVMVRGYAERSDYVLIVRSV